MSRKKKIVVPTEEEVAQYAGDPGSIKESASQPAAGDDEASPGAEAREATAATVESRPESEEWKEKFLRAKADLANYQRRAEKERADGVRYANARLVQALLPVLDDLERVICSGSEQTGDVEGVVNGVKLTLGNFLKVLRDFDVSPIEAEGQPFDPAVHEAMMQQPSSDHSEPTVLQEVVKGYRLHDRVLRPARVIVSKPEGATDANAGDEEKQE